MPSTKSYFLPTPVDLNTTDLNSFGIWISALELAGNLTLEVTDRMVLHQDAIQVIVRQRLLNIKYGSQQLITKRALGWAYNPDSLLRTHVMLALYNLAPWHKPDPPIMPRFVLFPRLAKVAGWWKCRRRLLRKM
jgi:hypothetical protein